jgi:pimeloyl-ACP methyl ester carboxylesterase
MKALLNTSLVTLLVALFVHSSDAASTRVPLPGIAIAEKDRAELRAGVDALAREINSLRSSGQRELLPDVEIFHKAVDWALRYDEFYRSNEVGLARTLLKQGMERAKQLREGKPSWLTATGLVVRGYVSKIDGSVQPYGLVVPSTFASDSKQPRRLDVWLHGRDDKLTELRFISDRERSYGEFTPADTFVLYPYGRYCNAFKFAGEIDVFEAMEHVKKSYRIDDRRIALRGFSMGGAGVWHLAAHHPDVWAVASPGAGFAETAEYTKALSKNPKPPAWEQKLWQLYDATDYAANFFNLPVVAYNGTEDPQRQAADVMERAMKAEGLTLPRVWGTNVPHKWTPEAKKEVSAFVDRQVARGKDRFPDKVHFTTRTLQFNKTARLTVLGLEQHWKRADVEMEFTKSGRLTIRTTNVSRFYTTWEQAQSPKEITVDGQANPFILSCDLGWCFAVTEKGKDGRWGMSKLQVEDDSIVKKHGLQGPIDDAFMDSFLVVRPTGKPQSASIGAWISSQLTKATNEWRAQFRGDARVKDDLEITDADIAANNLVLFGDPQSNKLLARIADKLPIRWDAYSVKLGAKSFASTTHVPVFIFPNPLNPKRYVVLNSGFTFAAAGLGSNAQQTPKLPDYAVLNVTDGSVALADFFDEQWGFH